MTSLGSERIYLIRVASGYRLHEVQGFPVSIKCLPNWNFFVRRQGDHWILTEVRSGAMFPRSFKVEMEEALQQFEAFCEARGVEECEVVFNKVIAKFGDLERKN